MLHKCLILAQIIALVLTAATYSEKEVAAEEKFIVIEEEKIENVHNLVIGFKGGNTITFRHKLYEYEYDSETKKVKVTWGKGMSCEYDAKKIEGLLISYFVGEREHKETSKGIKYYDYMACKFKSKYYEIEEE